ncbi:hypothetical protein V3C99_011755 [Haemonchus contortus]
METVNKNVRMLTGPERTPIEVGIRPKRKAVADINQRPRPNNMEADGLCSDCEELHEERGTGYDYHERSIAMRSGDEGRTPLRIHSCIRFSMAHLHHTVINR